ncbi:UPF0462 protein C4orf33-like [Dysidea avara]|uniref:UPF0462 protein C4orf33-like n=1 Tax=Dysidea avara TaxID=196820 RepID=UPI0033327D43
MEFKITKTWNGLEIDHAPVVISLQCEEGKGLRVNVQAPFFNSPPAPNSPAGQPCDRLWDYEVVEVFFANDKDEYLEVEFCPHGQHLVLFLEGIRNCIKDKLALDLITTKNSNATWDGTAYIPYSYFPHLVTKCNAFAIHGEGGNRTYEALYPSNGLAEPDFHRLEFFKEINFQSLVPPTEASSIGKAWTQ